MSNNETLLIIENKKIYTINEISKIAKPVFEKYNIEKAYIFGSYARGEATKNSDIDIMTVGEIRGFFAIGGLFEDLKEVLNKEIDLLREETYLNKTKYLKKENLDNFKKENENFYQKIFKERILIYEKEQ